jgi:hypothetical protein
MPLGCAFAASNGAAWTEIELSVSKPAQVAMMICIYKPPFFGPITAKDPAEDHAIVLSASDTELDEGGLGGILT